MVYKIRVILDSKDSIFRDIEIKEKQTLWNLHLGLKRIQFTRRRSLCLLFWMSKALK
jgi:hypothetical protein